jgi:hypothetical protein
MSARTHMLLREVGGTRYLLCDTKGSNLPSTSSFHQLHYPQQCQRCVQRWNKLARLADGDAEKMKSFLAIELGDKIERLRNII